MLALFFLFLAGGVSAAPAFADTAQGDGNVTVSYPGAPGNCLAPCTLTATDTLAANPAAGVVGWQWRCIDGGLVGAQPPNLANPTSGSPTMSCVMTPASFERTVFDIDLIRTYADGHTEVAGDYSVKAVLPQDLPSPVVVEVAPKVTAPVTVLVYTPKTTARLFWSCQGRIMECSGSPRESDR